MKAGKLFVFFFIVLVFCLCAFNYAPSVSAAVARAVTETPTVAPETADTLTPEGASAEDPAEMKKLVQDLHEKGIISTTDGAFHTIPDFHKEWAQLYYYRWWYSDYSPSNFVIKADLAWESASKTSNLGESGCGFVYHTDDKSNHHATFLMMDGKVQTYRVLNNNWTQMKGGYAGKFKNPADSAHMVLVVDKQKVTVFINDKQAVTFEDKKLEGGKLGLTLASGTNKGFGMHCDMTNVQLWELPE